MNQTTKRVSLIAVLLLSLPVLLFVYQPSIQLGAFGLLLGVLGKTLSPVVIFGAIGYLIFKEWN